MSFGDILLTVNDSYLIWLGDLNYRLNLTEPEVKSMLRQKQLDMLLEYDQVSKRYITFPLLPPFDGRS